MGSWKLVIVAAATVAVAACQTTDSGESRPRNTIPPASTSSGGSNDLGSSGGSTDAGTSMTGGGSTGGAGTTPRTSSGGSPSVPTLINVNLQNVLNNLSVSLQVNRNSVPVTAQVPIDVAAAVCGVSVDALAASVANGRGTCTATTTSPQLNQIVQQQISTGGNVQGGDQTLNTGGAN